MIRILSGFLSALFLFGAGASPCQSNQKEYHWYCAHVKDHKQPTIGTDLAFVEEYGGYFIDHAHSDENADEKVIYLTFDAGYENGNVAKILDILREESVSGAFFILGNLITHDTELVKRMAEEGHLVCNHTVRHKNMSGCSAEAFLTELHDLERLYKENTGYDLAHYYRPPEGTFSKENLITAQENGYQTVFWSFAYPDWDNGRQMPCERAKSIILDNVHNGEVMLLHPTSSTNAAILKDVIQVLKADGYRFGTLDELTQKEIDRE